MAGNSDASVGKFAVAVVEDDSGHDIPDNIDSSLYAETENDRVEFAIDPDDDLAELLRENGYTLPWEVESDEEEAEQLDKDDAEFDWTTV